MGDSFLAKGAWPAVDTVVSGPLLTCALWPLPSGSCRAEGLVGDPVLVVSPYPCLRMIVAERTHPHSPCSTRVQIVYLLLFVRKVSRNVHSGRRDSVRFGDRVARLPCGVEAPVEGSAKAC